ncbi:DUF6567 family protein [uncultured Pontibacter sp.]|uniref:DUF6567 family protein n=1 Tax=uncultured Pontibacter sp. TaxID=453356 RepID=UPI0026023E8F|nr:DUF6567 family protein [uncultured Pontibacter sp.]
MNKLLKSFGALLIAVTFSSCAAFHSGDMASSASLNSANFSYAKQSIKGESTATYVFGIGGMAKESLVANAKQQMLASNPLSANQALANVTVSYKSSLYVGLLYRTVTCTVTADVVEFNNSNVTAKQ